MQTHPSTLRLLSPQEPPTRAEPSARAERPDKEAASSFEQALTDAQPEMQKKPPPKEPLPSKPLHIDAPELPSVEQVAFLSTTFPSPLLLPTAQPLSRPAPPATLPLPQPLASLQAPDLRIQVSRLPKQLSTQSLRLDVPQDAPPPSFSLLPEATPAAEPDLLPKPLVSQVFVEDQESSPKPGPDPLSALPRFPAPSRIEEAPTLYQATEADTLPELPVSLPTGLHLEIQDEAGRWDLDVQRVGSEVYLEFQGDAQLRELVRESSREISQRFARHGELVGAIHWRPLETTSSHTGSESFNQQSHEKQQQHRQDPSEQDSSRQDAPSESFEQTLATT